MHFTTVASVSGRSTPVSEAKGGHDKHWCSANCSLSVKLIIFLALPFGGCSFCTFHFMSLFVVVTYVHSYSFLFYFGLKHHSCPSFSDSRPRGERARARLTM